MSESSFPFKLLGSWWVTEQHGDCPASSQQAVGSLGGLSVTTALPLLLNVDIQSFP